MQPLFHRKTIMVIKGYLFDMDGVLVDSEEVITKAGILALKCYGVNAKAADFKEFTGMGEDRFIGGTAEKHGLKFTPEIKEKAYDFYDEIVKKEIKLYKNTVFVLNKLKEKGFKLAVCSAADRRKVIANLNAADINREIFDALLTGSDVERKKPFPDIYLKGAELLNLKPCECIVLEDALSGIKAGKAAGCLTYGITTSFSASELQSSGADRVIEDIIELL